MFRIPLSARILVLFGLIAATACRGPEVRPHDAPSARRAEAYMLIAEIARTRDEPRVAATAYASAAEADGRLWPRAAEVASLSLQPSLALEAARRWIAQDPESVAARRIAARAALLLFKIGQAADDYRFVVANGRDGIETGIDAIAHELRGADDPYGARQVADRLAQAFPASAAARRLQGFAALRGGDPAAAVRAFEAALAQTPPAATRDRADDGARRAVVEELRRARVLSGDVAGPLAEALAAKKREDTPARRLDYAIVLLSARETVAARAQLHDLLRIPEYAPAARRILAVLDFQDGRLDAARSHFNALLTTGQYIDESFYYLGLIAERRGDSAQALRYLARVQRGDNVLPAMLRAIAILQAHDALSTADQLFDELLKDMPERAPQMFAARAEIYAKAGDAARALTLLNTAINEYPDSADLRYARASVEEDAGHVDAAVRELQALVKARPADPEAMNALGYTLADHSRRLGYARRLIVRALAAAPEDAAMRDSLGWVLYRQGHPAEALPLLSAAFAAEPGGDIGAHCGEVLWQLGKQAEAERVFAKAAEIDPSNPLLKSTRERLRAAPRANH